MKKRRDSAAPVVTRRQVLSLLGLGTLCCGRINPVDLIARSLVDGLIANAQAQNAGPTKNFVSILFPGAPTRWVWDGFLNPNNESIVTNRTVNNRLVTDVYDPALRNNVQYASSRINLAGGRFIYLPPLWSCNIPTSSGAPVPMSTLLDNTMIMRGVDMLFDLGHVKGPAKVLFPLGSEASLTGLVGDASQTTMPVVGLKGTYNYADPTYQGYKSLRGTTPILVSRSTVAGALDPLSATISPFVDSNATVVANARKLNAPGIQNAIKDAVDSLGAYASSTYPGSDVLYANSASATRLFQTAFGDIGGQYQRLFLKYQNLARACARTALPNILPTRGTAGYIAPNPSIVAGFSSELAYQFAVAEYLLVNGLSSTISICADNSVSFNGLFAPSDEHTIGDRQLSLIVQSYKFYSLAAMLREFRQVMIGAGVWNKTLVHISSEYGRLPRADLTGTDHASDSNVITMMSGAIKSPIFIGNIRANTGATGTYGVAAPVRTNDGDITINNNIAASTAAAILGVRSPVPQARSIVSVDANGDNVRSLVEPPRNV